MLVDCHAHLDPFTDDDVSRILCRAHAAGVGAVISAGTTVESSARSVELSARFPALFSGVGIHPMDITEPFDDSAAERLRSLATSTAKVVVFSELGLDFTGLKKAPSVKTFPLSAPKIALYKSWVSNMDEGWTRWLLKEYAFAVDTLHDAEVLALTIFSEIAEAWELETMR